MDFAIEMALEALEDQLDGLVGGSCRFCFGGWSDQAHVGLVEAFIEDGTSVSFVGYETL